MNKDIFTIGYSSFSLEGFVKTLKEYKINAIADVRSLPYSQFKPDFNRENLKDDLAKNNIAYVFLGEECGARVDDSDCYIDGKVDYNLVAQSEKFRTGLKRIKKGMGQFNIALMCSEKDPITCHRTILICRTLASSGTNIRHILSSGSIEEHKDSEIRLLKLHKLNHPDMFISEQQRLDEAYMRQGKKIAYELAESTVNHGSIK
ncbi:MAG: DUF488 domain-containing protein [Candidatus Electrothrix sp. LOE1_4_5]|nr:DUF488 domain-containing protein [Candidatus Electrothrix gigas]